MTGFAQSLRDAVRKLAYGASLDQLKKRGVKQVNVIGLDRVVSLVEQAVSRTLRSRLMGLEGAEIADEAKHEFLRMLQRADDLERSRDEMAEMQRRAQDEVAELRQRLEQQRVMLEDRLGIALADEADRYEGEDADLRRAIDAEFRAFAERGDTNMGGLRDRILDEFQSRIEAARREAAAAREAVRDREVDLLQRRIQKMSEALEANEARLAEVARIGNFDDGLASVYKSVQGLRPEAQQFARKKELMAEIFKANLALQKGTRE